MKVIPYTRGESVTTVVEGLKSFHKTLLKKKEKKKKERKLSNKS